MSKTEIEQRKTYMIAEYNKRADCNVEMEPDTPPTNITSVQFISTKEA